MRVALSLVCSLGFLGCSSSSLAEDASHAEAKAAHKAKAEKNAEKKAEKKAEKQAEKAAERAADTAADDAAIGRVPVAQAGADLAVHVGEGSGVVVKGGVAYVVDDERGVLAVKDGVSAVFAAATKENGLDDLEGITVKDGGLVVVNEAGVVSAIDDHGGVRALGRLPEPAVPNKGYEGIAFWKAPDGSRHYLLVNEAEPRALYVYSLDFVREAAFVASPAASAGVSALPAEIAALADDLSDVAVDEATGDVLLLSDESRRLLRVKLQLPTPAAAGTVKTAEPTLTLLKKTDLPLAKKEQVEGVFVDVDGRAILVTDHSQRLFAIAAGSF